ncbi:Adenylate_kinase [Hexamita inflata]|uniref:Adenylate kinase n=1 Tax=Hexamita inflata TaxID=28002 RepID=A0AA86Q653_9EUKA|nr:Adenylate kinase [Hexamita inflata]
MRILVTGPVASGKTTISSRLGSLLNFPVFNLSQLIIDNKFYTSRDEHFDTYIPDENLLMDYIRSSINPLENFIVDHHSFDIFGNVYFDLIVSITCIDPQDNLFTLRTRLEERKYSEPKILENLKVQLMNVINEELQRFKCKIININNISNENLENGINEVKETINQINKGEIKNRKQLQEEFERLIKEILTKQGAHGQDEMLDEIQYEGEEGEEEEEFGEEEWEEEEGKV